MGSRLWNTKHQDVVSEMHKAGFSRAKITKALRVYFGLSQKSAIGCFLSVVPRQTSPFKTGWRRVSSEFLDKHMDWDHFDSEVLESMREIPDITREACDLLYNQKGPLFRLMLVGRESLMAYQDCRKNRKQRRSKFTDIKTLYNLDSKKKKAAAVKKMERYATARTQESRGTSWARKR
tara:strand:- start:4178 stop:4711 length:534 start_codon:yes stop_codon:yes gene_type:complete